MRSLGHFTQNTQFVRITGSPLACLSRETMKNDFSDSIECHTAIVRDEPCSPSLLLLWFPRGGRSACFREFGLPSFIQDHACLGCSRGLSDPNTSSHNNKTDSSVHLFQLSWLLEWKSFITVFLHTGKGTESCEDIFKSRRRRMNKQREKRQE